MINKNFAMMILQMVSQTRAEACPPPCVNTTNELHLFGHRRGKKTSTPYTIRAGRCPQLTAFFTSAPILASWVAVSSFNAKATGRESLERLAEAALLRRFCGGAPASMKVKDR
jgi:hypothetical protein